VLTERPGAELLDLLGGAGAVIVLDAVRSGAAPGTVHDLALEELPGVAPAWSSHGLGVADALALARALGQRPRGRFIGIEAGPDRPMPSDTLHPRVVAAVEQAVCRARSWLDHFRRDQG
jgi:hydrogenase maturation protease